MHITKTLINLSAAILLIPTLPAQQPGQVATVGGTGTYGMSGEGSKTAQIEATFGIAVDVLGRVFVADTWNNRIRMIATDGVMTTVAGTDQPVGGSTRATSVALSCPRGVAVDAKGNVYIADTANSVVLKVAPDGTISTLAGAGRIDGFSGDGGSATSATLRWPRAVAVDDKGVVYIADSGNYRVRQVDASGKITTIAGTGVFGNTGDGGKASAAQIGMVHGIAVDAAGNLFLADPYNHTVRRVSPDGNISKIAGTGNPGFSGDSGPATSAALRLPRAVAADALGNLYITDTGNHRIRRVTPDGKIGTVACSGTAGFAGDAGPAANAQCDTPYAAAVDPRGNVFFADVRNYRIRKARLEQLTTAPEIPAGNVVNAASLTLPIAPGGLVAVFGKGFTYSSYSSELNPLPRTMGGATVFVDNVATPLSYVSPTQINLQLPWTNRAGNSKLRINFGGVETEVTIPVISSAPSIFLWRGNRGVFVNQDFTMNTPENPAARGSVVVLYVNSIGPVSPAVADGVASPVNPLAKAIETPTVTFGSARGGVQFSGLAPGFVGVWQLNVQIPADAPTGEVPVVVATSQTSSNTAMISVK